jgi:arylsulfatase A-like enzyme
LLLLGVLLASSVLPGCSKPPTPPLPENLKNVVIISIDTLRADHVGSYGYSKPTTPNLDRFAEENVRFARAYATSPWTLPSHASIFTGVYPAVHGANLSTNNINPRLPSIASELKGLGYKTGAIVCAPFLGTRYKLNQGFDLYDTKILNSKLYKKDPVAEKVTKKGLKFLKSVGQTPFFLFLQYWDPHHPYNPDQKYTDMFDPDYKGAIEGTDIRRRPDFNRKDLAPRDLEHILALYDGEIRYTDEWVQNFLDGLKKRGLADNTIVIILSDHGEEFLDHGGRAHLAQCWEETLRIPMMIRVPWITPKQKVVESLTSHIDVMPTIFALLGINKKIPHLQGVNLVPAFLDGTPLPQRAIMASTRIGQTTNDRSGPAGIWKVIIREDNLKYHDFRNSEYGFKKLFDLSKDPGEKIDISITQPEDAREMYSLLRKKVRTNRKMKTKLKRGLKKQDLKVEMDEDHKNKLRAVGYL